MSFVLIKFYSHTSLSLVIEVSVLGFHSLLFSLSWRKTKLTYCENPASVSCVLPVSDSTHWPEWTQQGPNALPQLSAHRQSGSPCRKSGCLPSAEE